MKGLLFVVAVVVLLILLGWITFGRSGDGNPTVHVETETIRDDTSKAAEKLGEGARKAAAGAEKVADEVGRTKVDVDVRQEPAGVDN